LPLYPPQVSLLFAPLEHLPYAWALLLWWTFSAAVYAVCCYGLWRACPNLRNSGLNVVLAAAGFPAFFHLIAWGQTSALALACFTLGFFLLRKKHEFLAGLALGCLIFKPQLGVAAAVVFVAIGAWKILAGSILSALAQLEVGVLYYGAAPLRQWVRALAAAPAMQSWFEPRPYQTHCLRTFWTLLIPWQNLAFALYVISAIAVLGLTLACWRRRPASPLGLKYSALLLATVLVAPHLTVYDLVILAPALLLITDWLVGQPSIPAGRCLAVLLYLVYMLPLLGFLAQWTHVQLSVVAMAACVYVVWQMTTASRTETSAPRENAAPMPIRDE